MLLPFVHINQVIWSAMEARLSRTNQAKKFHIYKMDILMI
jgi:hypothetical protein